MLGSLVAFTISVLIPHVYEVDMVVENVQIGMDKSGKRAYLGDLNDLKRLIDAGGFTQDILDSLIREQYKDVLPRRISFKTSLENNNQFAKIAYETVDVEMGEKILSQLFKRLQETNLVRIEPWKKEIDGKLEEKRAKIEKQKSYIKAQIEKQKEEIVLAEKRKRLMKEEMLDRTKADKRAKEATIKQLLKEINDVAMKRKIAMSKRMADMNAEKSMEEDKIKNTEKRNTEINSSIKLIKSEIDFLIKTRKELVSKKNETRDIGVVGELTFLIMDGYDKLTKLRQEINHNNDLKLQARRGIQKIDAGIRVLRDEARVPSKQIESLNDRIRQARLNIEALELPAKKLSDELVMSTSTDKPNSLLEAATAKLRDNVALITEEIGTLEANKKNVKNMVLIQPPTSSVSPLTPNTKRNVIIGAVVGLFLSLFLSVFLEYVYKKPEE